MRSTRVVLCLAVVFSVVAPLLLCGCTSQSTEPDPTTRPLADPMGYEPNFDESNISGGSTTNFDSNAFKKDVDHVANP